MDHVKLILRDPWWKRDFFLNAADHLAPRPISLGLSDILQIVKTQTRPQLNSTQPNITLSWVRHENDFAHHPTPIQFMYPERKSSLTFAPPCVLLWEETVTYLHPVPAQYLSTWAAL